MSCECENTSAPKVSHSMQFIVNDPFDTCDCDTRCSKCGKKKGLSRPYYFQTREMLC